MYKKHIVILISLSFLTGLICYLLELRVGSIASDVISVVSISSALYLAAYAGIQASNELKERLKQPDKILKHRTQRFVLNQYFKVALLLNVVTIISVCAYSLVTDRIAEFKPRFDCSIVNQYGECFSNTHAQTQKVPSVWTCAGLLLNFMSLSLFTANLIQMSFIGIFVVNRIPFDK